MAYDDSNVDLIMGLDCLSSKATDYLAEMELKRHWHIFTDLWPACLACIDPVVTSFPVVSMAQA